MSESDKQQATEDVAPSQALNETQQASTAANAESVQVEAAAENAADVIEVQDHTSTMENDGGGDFLSKSLEERLDMLRPENQ